MNCKEFADFLIDYVEGNLPDAQASAFDEHLQCCPPCIHYMQTYERCIELGKGCMECAEELSREPPEELIRAILAARKQI